MINVMTIVRKSVIITYVKNSVSGVALHVVGGLVEVADPRDVILPGDPDHVSGVGDDDGGVPHDITRVTFKDRRNDDHVVLPGKLNSDQRILFYIVRVVSSGTRSWSLK